MSDRADTLEVDAFLQTLDDTPPNAVTACRGWTTHELIAHLASGADAFTAQVEAHLEGRTVPEFGSWQVREPPYRAMQDAVLRRRLQTGEQRMTAAFEAMLAADQQIAVPEVGWGLPVAELVTHMRQEFAIHRWDLIGDDELGLELLGRQYLTEHSVRLLGDSLLGGVTQDPAPDEPLQVRIRCAGLADLVVRAGDGRGALSLEPEQDTAELIETDPAARLLLLWGRRPTDAGRVRSTLAPERLSRLQTVLTGY